jgi:hypothetical protein
LVHKKKHLNVAQGIVRIANHRAADLGQILRLHPMPGARHQCACGKQAQNAEPCEIEQ